VALGAIAVVVILLAVLILPSSNTPPQLKPSIQVTYAGARQLGDPADAGYQGGNRSLVYAVGVGFPTAFSVSPGDSILATGGLPPVTIGCVWSPSVPGNLTVPALSANPSSGAVPFWELVYKNLTGGIVVAVEDGAASVVDTLTGSECGSSLTRLASIPDGAIDSSAAMASFASYDAPFLSHFTNLAAEFELLPQGALPTPGTSLWSMVLLDCSGYGSIFEGYVNVSTGAPVSADTNVGQECNGSPPNNPIQNSLGLGSVYQSANTTNYESFRINVTSATDDVAWSDLSFALVDFDPLDLPPPAGAEFSIPETTGWSLDAMNATNVTMATFSPTNWSWSSGDAALLEPGDALQIQLNSTLESIPPFGQFTLFVGGQGAFSGLAAEELV
jgi:hypothetical protein